MLKPHQQRVVEELTALEEKLDKLEDFVNHSDFRSIVTSPLEQLLLHHQLTIMQTYSNILTMRIAGFPKD